MFSGGGGVALREQLIEQLKLQLRLLESGEMSDSAILSLPLLLPQTIEALGRIDQRLAQMAERMQGLQAAQSRTCVLAKGADEPNVVNLVTGITGNLQKDRGYLEKALRSTRELIILDPYLFSWSGGNRVFGKMTEYVNYVDRLVPPTTQQVEVFHLPSPNAGVLHRIVKRWSSRGIRVTRHETKEVHDRVLIKDRITATVVGTSLGGLGNKLSFALPLPQEDLPVLLAELQRIRTEGVAW